MSKKEQLKNILLGSLKFLNGVYKIITAILILYNTCQCNRRTGNQDNQKQ